MNHWKLFGQPGHGFCDKEETRKVSLHCTASIAWNSHIASSEARRFFSQHISPHKTETTTYDHQPSPGSSSNIRLTFELSSTRWHFGACCYRQIVENVEGLKGSLTSAGRFARLSLEDLIGSRFWSDPLCGSVENSIPTISCHVLRSELTRVKFRLGKFWLPARMARKMSVHLCRQAGSKDERSSCLTIEDADPILGENHMALGSIYRTLWSSKLLCNQWYQRMFWHLSWPYKRTPLLTPST